MTSGFPFVDVEVCSRWEEEGGGEEFEGRDYSDCAGSFRLIGLHPGSHAERQGPLAREVPAEERISGHVAGATYAPLRGVSVCGVWAESGETGGCPITGAYEFFPVEPGDLKIVFSPEPAEVEFH